MVGSPPVIHLLQWKFGTMDPPGKFVGSRTENTAIRPELKPKRAGKNGAQLRLDRPAWLFPFQGIPSNNDKRLSSNSCFSKMELAVAQPIRARVRRLPLLRGLEPNATLRSHRTLSGYAVFLRDDDSLYLRCHDSFIYTSNKRRPPLVSLPGIPQMFVYERMQGSPTLKRQRANNTSSE